jgi:hypothetical protein
MHNEESILSIDEYGTKRWRNKMAKLHRIDGPAVEYGEAKRFYLRGKYFKTKEAFFDALTDEEKSIALFSEDFHNA